MKIKTLLAGVIAAAFIFATSSAFASGEGWESNFKKASELAKKENKTMLLDFTGSDWCGWCIKLNKEVFTKAEFKEYAKKNLILVELDFPRNKTKISEETKKQNAELLKKYGVRGFPTIILLDPNGKKIGQTGYKRGGPVPYVKHLQEIIAKSKAVEPKKK